MKRLLNLSAGLLIIAILFNGGCKKETTADAADKFLGNYSYSMTIPGVNPQTGDMSITKTSSNKISLIVVGGTPTPYTVDGNNITEDAGQTGEIPLSGGGSATFTENSTGTLAGNVLTINGTWSNPLQTTITFTVVATKK